MFLNNFEGIIKEILFPTFCIFCTKEGKRLCIECINSLNLIPVFACPVCNKQNEKGECCENCKSNSALDTLYALNRYEENNIFGQLIKEFKYHHTLEYEEIWSVFYFRFIKKYQNFFSELPLECVPVPLHKRRERERGFNQSYILAKCFVESFSDKKFTINQGLIRHTYTKQQARLSKEKRIKNIEGVFSWQNSFMPDHILLFDDIFTTGNTLQECAKVLKKAGAKTVSGFVLARAKHD